MNNKIDIIIEARLGSKRFPSKHLLEIKGKKIIEILIERLKKVKTVNKIIIATTKKKEDIKFKAIAKKHKIDIYRGSENNVFNRVVCAGLKFNSNIICRVTGDCPLIDPLLIEDLVKKFNKNKKINYANNISGLPNGMACEIFYLKTLIKAKKFQLNSHDKEHVTLFVRRNPKIFNIFLDKANKINYYPELNITLDEPEDFILIKKIYLYFLKKNKKFKCSDIINLVKKNINLLRINEKIDRKDYFLEKLYGIQN
tara:strand:- start:537 stop:1301 length:765 start_codon:yes stop_codon:yes gene_type:complete